jgi:beta-phosphoglucomutase-like phosphatase (HAD superfamily)
MIDINSIDLFIFDFDGTIIDSTSFWFHASSLYLKYKNIDVDFDIDKDVTWFYCEENFKRILSFYKLYDENNNLLNPKNMKEDVLKFIDTTYPKLPYKEGIIDIIKYLKNNNKKIIILSSSPKRIIDLSLKEHNCLSLFDDVISLDDLKLNKHDGTGYKYILNKYNLNLDKIIYFEDTYEAIIEAVNHNIKTIVISDPYNEYKKEELYNLTNTYIDTKDLHKIFR